MNPRAAARIGLLFAGLLAALAPALAQQPGALRARPSTQGLSPTDAEVLQSIQAGVDALLKSRQGNHWESLFDATGKALTKRPNRKSGAEEDTTWPGVNFGGETAIVVYALLHVGKGLEDERLDYKSKELQPAIKFLCDLKIEATYTAGLQANALALVAKTERTEVKKGLENARDYLLAGMGADGGYKYRSVAEAVKLPEMWTTYYTAKVAKDPKVKEYRNWLDQTVQAVDATAFGGFEVAVRQLAARLLERRKDPAQRAAAEAELLELERYLPEGRAAVLAATPRRLLADALAELRAAEDVLRKGPYGTRRDANNKDVPKTRADIEDDIRKIKLRVAKYENDVKGGIEPAGDLSNGQYGTLGAWALEEGRVEVPLEYWKVSDKFWRLTQQPAGTWSYAPGNGDMKPSATMTIAGIASLFITTEYTDVELRLQPKADPQVDAGLAWLHANYNAASKDLYYLYGAERVGLASGLKFFGASNWYREGTKVLLREQQKPAGAWAYTSVGPGTDNVGTAYALLFLARGRNPVAFNKLQYQGPWNARPRDAAHLVEWMSKEAEKPLNWQIVDLQLRTEDWLDAPVLLVTGSQDPRFTPEQVAKLKAYVEAGGTIFSTADGNTDAFTKAMTRYMAQICDNKFEPRELPKDHVIFSKDCWQPVANPPRMLGLSNGLREWWVHSPQDLGASWQMRRAATKEHFQIPADVCFYATGGKKLLRSRLQPLAVTEPKDPPTAQLAVGRVQYNDGNWDPEPGAWPRMAKVAAADYQLGVTLRTVNLEELDQVDPKTVPLLHLTGATRFRAGPERAKALRSYLDRGGMLLADAAGGSKEGAAAIRALLQETYPDGDNVPAPLPPDHLLYNGRLPHAEKLAEVEYRKFARLKLGGGNSPRLQGLQRAGRLQVLLSEEDLTSGLLGTNTLGILGYSADSAERLVGHILLYAAHKGTEPRP